MGINIQGITGKQTSSRTKKAGSSAAKKGVSPASEKSSTGQNDSVNLTDAASLIQKAEQALAAVPMVNADHVNDVSSRNANGQYEIDDKQIADKIIELENNFTE